MPSIHTRGTDLRTETKFSSHWARGERDVVEFQPPSVDIRELFDDAESLRRWKAEYFLNSIFLYYYQIFLYIMNMNNKNFLYSTENTDAIGIPPETRPLTAARPRWHENLFKTEFFDREREQAFLW